MSTFVSSNKLYMIMKLNIKGGFPMLRIGHTHSNKNLLYSIAIAKQQGKTVDLANIPCEDKQEIILSTLRNQEFARQMSNYSSNVSWMYFVYEVPQQKPLA
jgi:hypothetical protein